MRLSASTLFLLCCLLFSQCQGPTHAAKQSYVVYLGAHSHGPAVSSVDLNRVTQYHHEFLGSFLGSNENPEDAIFYSYTRHINGFAAKLDDAVAAEIAKHPKVVSVFLSKENKLHTTHSWEFLGLEQNGRIPPNSIWEKARYGEDVVIGNIDTGVWPESKSFSDEGFGPIPSKWKGICQNDKDSRFHCNRKLIGARYFNQDYAVHKGPLNSSFYSPRDINGHGTHTLSTAGGNFVAGASVFGFGKGTAKGGSPKARVAAYKVCWEGLGGCYDCDIIAAFDMAIHDGVDVLSVSLGVKRPTFFGDGVAIGSFHAVQHGIVVVCSAGNKGPADSTVENVAPWQIVVGASTMDRDFPNYVVLGNNKRFKGDSLSEKGLPSDKLFPFISAEDAKLANASIENAFECKKGTLDPKKVKGKILVCLDVNTSSVDKGLQAALAGAVGVVLINIQDFGYDRTADPHVLPASAISFNDGDSLLGYVNSTKHPVGFITRPTTEFGAKPSPFMAAFSSKGPNHITPEILKPDITAPGENIIAAYTEAESPTNLNEDKHRIPFNSISGTSMSCPHISGIAGLLKTLHPDWSPAAIQSAIMTTATTLDNNKQQILNASFAEATPFSYGAGHVQPNLAMDPGLVYDLTVNDYLNFLCALGYNKNVISLFSTNCSYTCPKNAISLVNFNYPAITVPKLSGSITVTRRVKNVGSPGTYQARVKTPEGVSVTIAPKSLKFINVGEEKSFKVIIKAKNASVTKDYAFGELIWSDEKQHRVRSPIVVKAV
ncbi:subtilisin-like protease SBT5.3 [Citrus clementina]|uniref:subtilisin-like protease SBT5.3 n=1 Tax=Citrus clementina TaxID=85681 RepID=UPI000CED653D|nr:subtilisin-like protease SBT5.3 [Citrus x clementina]